MPITTLYRPMGLKEYRLVAESKFTRFPPRLPGQPFFYPVVTEEYAREIALKWNATSCDNGIVLAFDMDDTIFEEYPIQKVGGGIHKEIWVPANLLEAFNNKIIGPIRCIANYAKCERCEGKGFYEDGVPF